MTTRIESLDLIHLQLALECQGFNSECLLVRIPGPEPDEIARYLAYHVAEGWARTVPGYRQRGYARQTTAAWAAFVLQHNKVAFYSHASDNHASKAVAHGLALIPFASYVSCG